MSKRLTRKQSLATRRPPALVVVDCDCGLKIRAGSFDEADGLLILHQRKNHPDRWAERLADAKRLVDPDSGVKLMIQMMEDQNPTEEDFLKFGHWAQQSLALQGCKVEFLDGVFAGLRHLSAQQVGAAVSTAPEAK